MQVQKVPEVEITAPNTTLPPSSAASKPKKNSNSANIGLVQSIIEENTTLKNQINHLQAEIDKARTLSNGLLTQNKGLRQLYQQRTKDIVKLIKSISIQAQEEVGDYQHQCHLVKQLNFATLKQIKLLDQEKREIQERNSLQKNNITLISEQKNQLEHHQLNKLKARLENGISPEAVNKKKKAYELQLDTNRVLEKEVDQLLQFNTKIRREIVHIVRTESIHRQAIALEKQDCQQNVANVKSLNEKNREELANLKYDCQQSKQDKRLKEQRFNQVAQSLKNEMKKYEHHQRYFNTLNSDREKVKTKIGQSIQKQELLHSELEKVREQKEKLFKIIQNIKQVKKSNYENAISKEEAQQQNNRENIRKLSNQQFKNQANFNEQKQKIVSEKKIVEKNIESLQHEYGSLEDQANEYKKLLKDYTNPICQIERIELSMRLKGIR